MAPLELARETSACLPRAGVGGLRGDTRSLPPPVRYLGPAATRLEGAADDGAYRNVLPHPGAQSRHQTPPGSRVLTAASWVGQWRRGPLRMLRGLQPRCAHISPRASIPQGAAAGVSVSLSRPGVCGGRVRRDGQIGPRGRWPLGCHWPYCHKQSDPVAPWPRAAAQAPPWSPPTPTTCPRPTTKCCAHQAKNQLNIWASCKVSLPALAQLCRAFRVTHRLLSYPRSCWVPAISDQLAGHCREPQIHVRLECLRWGHRKQSPTQRPRQPEPPYIGTLFLPPRPPRGQRC